MKFLQNKDGSGEWQFSDEEIEIINKSKKLIMTPGFLKDFKNVLMKLIVDVTEKLPKDLRNKDTKESPKPDQF
mgnify:CR=1 FL=1|tara:strand:- start:381 stop:599 length:219 start_codon:yes stop_codon:yes gene_type:complete